MITDAELQTLAEQGFVTVDSPFTAAQLADAARDLDALCPHNPEQVPGGYSEVNAMGEIVPTGNHRTTTAVDASNATQALLELTQHPWVEAVASRLLGAHSVRWWGCSGTVSYPEPEPPEAYSLHVDAQLLPEHLSRPATTLAVLWLWLSDVTERDGPLMIRPTSHRMLVRARGGAGCTILAYTGCTACVITA
jgi:hypothetical protein